MQVESNANTETPQSVKAQGLKFLESLKAAKDKTYVPGHILCYVGKSVRALAGFAECQTHDTDLTQWTTYSSPLSHTPKQGMHTHCTARDELANKASQSELPEYYDTIKLPIAIDTIEVCSQLYLHEPFHPSRSTYHLPPTILEPTHPPQQR